MNKELKNIKEFLDEYYLRYNAASFIENDPILIPHRFEKKEDIEIAGFLTATIAWGNRKAIIANALKLMTWMDDAPHEFLLNHSVNELKTFDRFVHRTFNGKDCRFFISSLKNLYLNHQGLEAAFSRAEAPDLKYNIAGFRELFLAPKHLARSDKHVSNPLQKSSAKRLCMFLRWMVRSDRHGVDFGIWKSIPAASLCLPLDVHTGNVSRALGLLQRRQNDWTAVEEITSVLREFDPSDPVKYDFALFGLGVDKVLK